LPAEELIAELCAAFPCAEFGFDGDVRNAGYIANWIELLKADKRALFTACSVPTVNRRGVPTPIGELSR
jgi:antirestriction protein ArdC